MKKTNKLLGIGIVVVLLLASLVPMSMCAATLIPADEVAFREGGRELSPIGKLFSYLNIYGASDIQLSSWGNTVGDINAGTARLAYPTTTFELNENGTLNVYYPAELCENPTQCEESPILVTTATGISVLFTTRDVRGGGVIEFFLVSPDGTQVPALFYVLVVDGDNKMTNVWTIGWWKDYDIYQCHLGATPKQSMWWEEEERWAIPWEEGVWKIKAVEQRESERILLAEMPFTIVGLAEYPKPETVYPSSWLDLVSMFWTWLKGLF